MSNSARSSLRIWLASRSDRARMSARTACSADSKSASSASISDLSIDLSGTTSRSAGGSTTTAVPTAAPGAPGMPMKRVSWIPLPWRPRPRIEPVASAWAMTPASCALMVTRKASSPSSN